MKNPFLKFLIKDKKEQVFHSSEYGVAQSGKNIGATSTESFDMRMKIDKNRRIVRRYNDSRVAEQRFNGGVRAKQYETPVQKEDLGVKKIKGDQLREAPKSIDVGGESRPPVYKNRFGK